MELAASKPRALRDTSLLTTRGTWVGLRGGITQDTMRNMTPGEVNASQYADEIRSQIAWLHKLDAKLEGAEATIP